MNFFAKAVRVLWDFEMLRMYARWQSALLLGRPPTLNLHGAELTGFPNFSAYWGAWWGRPTPGELGLICRVASEGGTIIDIGGNFGVFSILLSHANADAKIHAFEPVRETYMAFTRNIEANACTNVRAWQMAMADRVGEMHMTTTTDPATNRLLQASEKFSSTEVVPTTTLDHHCRQQGLEQISFVKIDVEGAEPLVLAGARGLLARGAIGSALVEVCPANLTKLNFTVADLLSPLEAAGYRLFALEANGAVGRSQALEDLEGVSLVNMLALPR